MISENNMDTSSPLFNTLDQLATKQELVKTSDVALKTDDNALFNAYNSILKDSDYQAIGTLSVDHVFGKIVDYSLNHCDSTTDVGQDILSLLSEEKEESNSDIDSLLLQEFAWEDREYFFVPVKDNAISIDAIVMISGGEFDSDKLAELFEDCLTPVPAKDKHIVPEYSQEVVTDLVKMVNAGEDITADTEELDSEYEEEVLVFRDL